MLHDSLTVRPAVAFIDEQRCIGCTLCIHVCPVDAIVGAAKLMHTIIAEACIGCELCVPPCPVDCISIRQSAPLTNEAFSAAQNAARRRAEARNRRLQRARDERAARAGATRKKRETIAKALARARVRLEKR